MKKSQVILHSLFHSLGVLAYIGCVTLFMQNFVVNGSLDNIPAPLAMIGMLTVLVISVAMMAVLIFARPIYLYFNGLKKESIQFLIYTIGWLLLIFIIVFSGVVIFQDKFPNPPQYNNLQ